MEANALSVTLRIDIRVISKSSSTSFRAIEQSVAAHVSRIFENFGAKAERLKTEGDLKYWIVSDPPSFQSMLQSLVELASELRSGGLEDVPPATLGLNVLLTRESPIESKSVPPLNKYFFDGFILADEDIYYEVASLGRWQPIEPPQLPAEIAKEFRVLYELLWDGESRLRGMPSTSSMENDFGGEVIKEAPTQGRSRDQERTHEPATKQGAIHIPQDESSTPTESPTVSKEQNQLQEEPPQAVQQPAPVEEKTQAQNNYLLCFQGYVFIGPDDNASEVRWTAEENLRPRVDEICQSRGGTLKWGGDADRAFEFSSAGQAIEAAVLVQEGLAALPILLPHNGKNIRLNVGALVLLSSESEIAREKRAVFVRDGQILCSLQVNQAAQSQLPSVSFKQWDFDSNIGALKAIYFELIYDDQVRDAPMVVVDGENIIGKTSGIVSSQVGEGTGTPNSAPGSDEKPQEGPEPISDPPPLPPFAEIPPELLSDLAIGTESEDLLALGEIANSIADFIHNPGTKTPFVLAINAPWGAGKTSLTNLISRKLERRNFWEKLCSIFRNWDKGQKLQGWLCKGSAGSSRRRLGESIRDSRAEGPRLRHTICKFNAWFHDDSPNLTASFAQEVTRRANDARNLFSQTILRPTAWKQSSKFVNVVRLIIAGEIMAILSCLGYNAYQAEGQFYAIVSSIGGTWEPLKTLTSTALTLPAVFGFAITVFNKVKNGLDSVTKFLNDPEKVAATGQIYNVRKRLGGLMQQATTFNRRFVIIVDDLERCKPENSLAILDLVNQLLSHPNVVVIISGDMEMIAAAAGSKYKEQAKLLSGDTDEECACLEYGRKYLQKVVQMQFDLPPPVGAQLEDLTSAKTQIDPPAGKAKGRGWLGRAFGTLAAVGGALLSLINAILKLIPRGGGPEQPMIEAARTASESFGTEVKTVREAHERLEEIGITDAAVRQQVVQELVERRLATGEAIGFLAKERDLTPRQIKRYENALRVHFRILVDRGIKVTDDLPKQMAKWLVLQSDWPGVVNQIGFEPTMLKEIEAVRSRKDFQEVLKLNFPGVGDYADLAQLLRLEPMLGDSTDLLINLRMENKAPDATHAVVDTPNEPAKPKAGAKK